MGNEGDKEVRKAGVTSRGSSSKLEGRDLCGGNDWVYFTNNDMVGGVDCDRGRAVGA